MERPRAIIFDIGSTLWSSPPEDPGALANCYGRASQLLPDSGSGEIPQLPALIDAVEGYFAEWEEIWRRDPSLVRQGPTTDFVAAALSRLGIELPLDALTSFTDTILETSIYTAKTLAPEPGMPEALAALKARGLRLAGLSNAFMTAAGLMAIMDERGLGPHLDLMLSSCELGVRKPDPEIYRAALAALEVEPAQAVFVGDRLDADIAGPSALGMRTVLTFQYRREDPTGATVQPDHVIEHLSGLVPYVESLLEE